MSQLFWGHSRTQGREFFLHLPQFQLFYGRCQRYPLKASSLLNSSFAESEEYINYLFKIFTNIEDFMAFNPRKLI
ncbi:MAG: hypothetical protein C0598_12835 [Marinilabiliales bacterium]|nr:MAG: hypothetical protein C0598_12835 [Marinilabiliales bacterium]